MQSFIDQVHSALLYLLHESPLSRDDKFSLCKHLNANFGRTALCLSGGASFAWYHYGVVKALLDSNLLPDVVTGTSGGALVAALVATRTNEELKSLLYVFSLHVLYLIASISPFKSNAGLFDDYPYLKALRIMELID